MLFQFASFANPLTHPG